MNPHLPQLFRDIFRGAYVPYRDPETLNMFLKEISDFKYDHSEELGNAFEYLLSIMGSQGDAGQFRTPRHIIDMMVEIIDPKKTDSILDPACGTAGFLISSYKHILDKNKDKEGHSTLSADERKRMTENFAGYDISPDMVRLSRVNMYLHKFAKPQISEYDTLSSLDKWDDSYDIILANPPFMTPKGGIIPHNRYRIQAKRAEVLFVDYIAEHLNPTGKAGVIVPEGIVFQSANAYKALRKYLVEDDLLYAVISLPAGVFNPYSGVKTSILLMDKTLAKQKDEILFVRIDNDGYNLGAQRREIKGSDIPEVIKIIKDYQNGLDIPDNPLVTIASKKDIADQDYILVGDRYKEAVVVNSDYPMVELSKLCDLQNGYAIKSADYVEFSNTLNFRMSNIRPDGSVDLDYNIKYLPDNYAAELSDYLLQDGDVVIAMTDMASEPKILGVPTIIKKDERNLILNQRVGKFKDINQDKLFIPYLKYILNFQGVKEYYKSLSGGGLQINIGKNDILKIKIPLPPLHIQEEIVKEMEGYQKVIDGAKQVVENYKPTIKVDPSWEMVKLGDVCEIISGQSPDSKYYNTNEEGLPFYQGKTEFTDKYLGKPVKWTTDVTKESLPNDILMSVRAPVGPVNINKDRICIGRGLAAIRCKNGILVDYLFVYLLGIQKDITGNGGAVFDSISRIGISSINIPLPALETQNEIVRKINEEMTIIDQNKRLIEIFEQKIKDKISEVWGD
jgi:type I restriction enzyme M protein